MKNEKETIIELEQKISDLEYHTGIVEGRFNEMADDIERLEGENKELKENTAIQFGEQLSKNMLLKEGYNEQVISIEGLANERDLYSDQAKEMQLQIQECKKLFKLFYNEASYVNLSNDEQTEFSKLFNNVYFCRHRSDGFYLFKKYCN